VRWKFQGGKCKNCRGCNHIQSWGNRITIKSGDSKSKEGAVAWGICKEPGEVSNKIQALGKNRKGHRLKKIGGRFFQKSQEENQIPETQKRLYDSKEVKRGDRREPHGSF